MEVLIDATLLSGEPGTRLRKASRLSGWREIIPGTFEKPVGTGSLRLLTIPCSAEDGFVAAVANGVNVPEAAVIPEKALLETYDDPVFCPEGTTLVSGDLLLYPGETQNQLFERILSDWEWWMNLRASSRELAISWGAAPDRNLLFLINRLDAGFLDKFPQHALASDRITRLVGFHPATTLLAKSAGIPVLGLEEPHPRTRLLTTWALGKATFWSSLQSEPAGSGK